MRIRLTDTRNQSVRELDLPLESRDLPGWQSGVVGWSIGPKGSGAPIELDEPLGDCHVGVFSASLQLLLWGMAKELPVVKVLPQDGPPGKLLPFEPARWLVVGRAELSRVAMGGDVKLRFDQSPILFGNYILESMSAMEAAKEYCTSCGEVLHSYFRVGSLAVCPACTQKFKQEKLASLAGYYRRALRYGILVALAGSAIHAVFLAAGHVSFGAILIGILVGVAMRILSKESAGNLYRWTAVVLTLLAGGLPGGLLPFGAPWNGGTLMSAVYLGIGMFAAWTLVSRNVPTEVHGPFQAKTT